MQIAALIAAKASQVTRLAASPIDSKDTASFVAVPLLRNIKKRPVMSGVFFSQKNPGSGFDISPRHIRVFRQMVLTS